MKRFQDLSALSSILNIIASAFFLLGSILFLPPYAEYAVTGTWCFVMGSMVFLLASVREFLRLNQ